MTEEWGTERRRGGEAESFYKGVSDVFIIFFPTFSMFWTLNVNVESSLPRRLTVFARASVAPPSICYMIWLFLNSDSLIAKWTLRRGFT